MTDLQYAQAVVMLAALGQRANAFDGLTDDELFNLVFLLGEAQDAAGRACQARGMAERDRRLAALEAENARLRHEVNNQAQTAGLIEQIIARADAAEMRAARADAEIQAARALFDYIYKRSDGQTAEEAQLIDAYAQAREAAE